MSTVPTPPSIDPSRIDPEKARAAAIAASANLDPAQAKTAAQQQVRSGLDRIWWLLLLQGIAALVVGGLFLLNPSATSVGVTLVLGIWLLVQGVLQLIHIFVEDHRAWYWNLLWGILGIVAGLVVLANPLISSVIGGATLVFLLAFLAILMGGIALIRGVQGGGLWQIVLGIINILIGVYLLFNPLGATVALPWVLGFFAIIGGIMLIFMAFQARSARNAIPV